MHSFYSCYFILLLSFTGCSDRYNSTNKAINNTTKALEVGLEQAISIQFMPDASSLKRSLKFNDSILLTADSLPLKLLPTMSNKQPFKILPKQTINPNLFNKDSRNVIPNYLCITKFEENDSGYYIQFENRGMAKFSSGGSLSLTIKKNGDSLEIIGRSASSIN